MQNPTVAPPDLPKIHKLIMKKSLYGLAPLHRQVSDEPNQSICSCIYFLKNFSPAGALGFSTL